MVERFCPDCAGYGFTAPAPHDNTCPTCHGTGLVGEGTP